MSVGRVLLVEPTEVTRLKVPPVTQNLMHKGLVPLQL